MNALILLSPEIFLSLAAFVVMLGEAFAPTRAKLWLSVACGSLKIVAVYLAFFFISGAMPGAAALGIEPPARFGMWIAYEPVFGMAVVDSQAVFFKLILVIATLLVLGFSFDYREYAGFDGGTYGSLLLFATVGMMFLVGSTDLLLAVVALELLSIPSFILTGFIFGRRSGTEGAIKFFLVGTFSTGLLLFGISYYYGYFGTTNLQALWDFAAEASAVSPFMLTFTLVFLLAGLGFKLAMAPFHMWAPDAYEAAPTPITAFLSVAPKAAAIGFIMRAFGDHAALGLTPVLAVLAAVTMTVGNVGALRQTNVKRLLAYSSIAQVGYILVAFTAGGALGREATLIYTLVYLFMNLGVFGVLIVVSNSAQSDDMPAFAGLSARSFGLAAALVVFLLSMTGIPPLAGFIGKFEVFAAVIRAEGLVWLGIVAVVNSVISLYYYFRLAHQAFFVPEQGNLPALRFNAPMISCLILTLGVTIVVGILPNPVLGWVRNVLGS